jgi:hypothetical protein
METALTYPTRGRASRETSCLTESAWADHPFAPLPLELTRSSNLLPTPTSLCPLVMGAVDSSPAHAASGMAGRMSEDVLRMIDSREGGGGPSSLSCGIRAERGQPSAAAALDDMMSPNQPLQPPMVDAERGDGAGKLWPSSRDREGLIGVRPTGRPLPSSLPKGHPSH